MDISSKSVSLKLQIVPPILETQIGAVVPYFNGYDQCVAKQHLCKHSPTNNNTENGVFCRSDRRANRLAG
jgi:hypothetical protein